MVRLSKRCRADEKALVHCHRAEVFAGLEARERIVTKGDEKWIWAGVGMAFVF